MKRALTVLAIAALLLPVTALGHDGIDVQVTLAGGPGWHDDETWIEFEAEHDAFVAVYATFSDGSFAMVFPVSQSQSHWVQGCERYAVPVSSPYGVWLEDVQAIASAHWFDPDECWLAFDHGYEWRAPRVLVATAWPSWSWGFSFAWSSHSRCWAPVRCIDWYAPRCNYGSRFDRTWYRSSYRDWDGSWGRHWDRNGRRSRDRADRIVYRDPSRSKERHVVKGETRTAPKVRREVASQAPRQVASKEQRQVVVSKEKRTQGAVRNTSGETSKKRTESAPARKSSSSRGNSGEPKRRSGR